MTLRVECYAGHRADERPVRFEMGGHLFEVAAVEDQWYSSEARYFRVIAQDGNLYVLKHSEARDEWTLEGFRARRSGDQDERRPESPPL